MKNIYRTLSVLLAVLLLAAVLTGCGGNKSEDAAQDASSEIGTTDDTASEEASAEVEVASAAAAANGIVSVTLIEDENGAAAAAAVEYNTEIDADSISPSDYLITSADQSLQYYVTAIYTNDAPAMADTSSAGRYVIIELSENASDAMAEPEEEDVTYVEDDGTEGPAAEETEDEEEVSPENGPLSENAEDDAVITEGPGGEMDPSITPIVGVSPSEMASAEMTESESSELSITVIQIDTVKTVDGSEIGPTPSQYTSDTVVSAD